MAAVISQCGQYRYRLERTIGLFGPVAVVIMVNPSTADAQMDDATIRRIVGFGKRLGWSRVIVGNVFAYRATNVRELMTAGAPVGPENSIYLREMLLESDIVLVAWGPLAKLPIALREEWRTVFMMATELGKKLHCLGSAQDGHPRHPLMLSYAAELTEWRVP